MNQINTIIFDLDGTILDTLLDITNALNHTLASYDRELKTELEVRSFLGNGARFLIAKALGNNIYELDKIYKDYVAYYEKNAEILTKPYEGIETLLTNLKGKYKLGVVSNKHNEAVVSIINKYFPNTFDYVLGETKGLLKKPAPDMVNLALGALNSKKEETIFIGDSQVDIETAKNANIKSIAVTWGFRDKADLVLTNPDYIVDKVEEILNILNN